MRIREAYKIPDHQDDGLSKLRSARVEAMPAEEGSEGEDPPPVSLEGLKSFIITSEAFCNLRNAFHHLVYPGSLTAISDIIYKSLGSSGPYDGTESSTATFNVRWSLDDYVMTELSYDSELRKRKQLLDSVVVVVGREVRHMQLLPLDTCAGGGRIPIQTYCVLYTPILTETHRVSYLPDLSHR